MCVHAADDGERVGNRLAKLDVEELIAPINQWAKENDIPHIAL